MKERQRWRPEEDALLCAYVKQYGPREWHLVSQRMNKPIDRDSKSCLERWKNYLKPGIKKGSLTQDEQRLVINLQAKHGNKWKKIAGQVPGRTAKRLGKWWEVFKEKQSKHKETSNEIAEQGKYDRILETFAEKLVKEPSVSGIITMPTPNGGFLHADQSSGQSVLPPWLASSSTTPSVRPQSPSVTLSLSPSITVQQVPTLLSWLHPDHSNSHQNASNMVSNFSPLGIASPMLGDTSMIGELIDCCKEIEEGQRAWAAHRKETAWRLKRVELQLESEKACRRREKMDDTEAKIKALREEQRAALDRIETEYREQLAGLRREAEVKEQKLAEQWAAKHLRLTKFLEQLGYRSTATGEPNGR